MSISKKPEICECETTSLHHYDCKKTEKCEECGSRLNSLQLYNDSRLNSLHHYDCKKTEKCEECGSRTDVFPFHEYDCNKK